MNKGVKFFPEASGELRRDWEENQDCAPKKESVKGLIDAGASALSPDLAQLLASLFMPPIVHLN